MHSVGASSVHSSYSDGIIRDMPVIADLNITSVSEIQDTPMSPPKNYHKRYGWWGVILSPSWHWAPAFISSSANFLQFQQCRSFGGFQWTRQRGGFTKVWWSVTMMAVIWYHHQLPIPLNAVLNDSYLTERKPQSISTVEENENVLVRSNFKETWWGTVISLKLFSFASSLFDFFWVFECQCMSPSLVVLFDLHLCHFSLSFTKLTHSLIKRYLANLKDIIMKKWTELMKEISNLICCWVLLIFMAKKFPKCF